MNWTVSSSEQVFRDRWLSVRADTCSTPDGAVVSPYYVLEYPDWVNVVALTTQEDVVLVRQYRHGIGQTLIELPCGAVEEDDASPLGAARRELLEETGYQAETFVSSGVLSPNPATHNNSTHCFLATGCRSVASPVQDETERTEVVLMPLQKFAETVLAGGLYQALHVGSALFGLSKLGLVQIAER
jgi:ADP-ribose pyrophosphatase